MGAQTGIEWTSRTYNPWQGCTKVSPGCKFCYMYADKRRYGQDPTVVVRSLPPTFNQPLAQFGPRSTKGTPGEWKWPDGNMVFTCSWSDWFHEGADEWRQDAWDIVKARPGLIFQILTKRPENVLSRLPDDWGEGYDNVWLGVSVEDQERMHRVETLQGIPAKTKFISAEPLLGPLVFPDSDELLFDWAIIGGESGVNARIMDPAWAIAVRDYCDSQGIPLFFKQWGAFNEVGNRVGKKVAGCILEGIERKEFPRGASI